MHEIKPDPYCDALHIFSTLRKSIQPISTIETHLFAYLSCILGLWEGRSLSQWGYAFAVTSEGFPYSADFEDARAELVPRGLVASDSDGRLRPDKAALDREIDDLFSSKRWRERRKFTEAAVSCALAFPTGLIRYAIGQSPNMRTASLLHQRSALFTESDVENIYQEYTIVRNAIEGDASDLLSPAVIWLSVRLLNTEMDLAIA